MNQNDFEKFNIFTFLMMTLPEEKQAAVGYALMLKLTLDENPYNEISEISEKVKKVSVDRIMQALNDGYATLEVNKKGKTVLTFKSEDKCMLEKFALILVSTLQVKSCNLPILRCGEKEIRMFSRERDKRGKFI